MYFMQNLDKLLITERRIRLPKTIYKYTTSISKSNYIYKARDFMKQ